MSNTIQDEKSRYLKSRYLKGLQTLFGEVWNSYEFEMLFTLEACDGCCLIVTRNSDGACGSVLFGTYPIDLGGHRFYHSFSE